MISEILCTKDLGTYQCIAAGTFMGRLPKLQEGLRPLCGKGSLTEIGIGDVYHTRWRLTLERR